MKELNSTSNYSVRKHPGVWKISLKQNAVAFGKNSGIMQLRQKKKVKRAGAKFLRAMFYFPAAGGGRVKARIYRRPAKIYRSKYRALDSVEVYKGPCPVTTNFYSHPRTALGKGS